NKAKDMEGYVGFANLPNQVYRRSVKRGFEFTLMVVGESGLGKSTLINSLFLTDIYSSVYPGPSQRIKKTVKVETSNVHLKENGVNLRLTIVDTPGFGDQVDNSNCWQPILEHIDTKFEEYLNSESRVNRCSLPDKRVHCCLYFIAPSGHGLKPLDVELMKRLHDRVNIIPLIAKADTLTPDECKEFQEKGKKKLCLVTLRNKSMSMSSGYSEVHYVNKQERVPFAVVGSNMILEANGKRVRGRQYPWGIAEVENLEHCDFIPLRNMLIRTHMQDLKDVTNNVHYENYRCKNLTAVTAGDGKKPSPKMVGKNPLAQFEEEKKEHEVRMQKMKSEMEQVFEMKVQEKKQKLKDSEMDLQKRLETMKKSLEQQQKEVEDKRSRFEAEKKAFEQLMEDRRRNDTKKSKTLKGGRLFASPGHD
ncbi:putative septin-7 isoform X6, partial [Apostichopus japonicus]